MCVCVFTTNFAQRVSNGGEYEIKWDYDWDYDDDDDYGEFVSLYSSFTYT